MPLRGGHIIKANSAANSCHPAATPGPWAGGHDAVALDPDWGQSYGGGRLPGFSACTFPSEAEMRPTVRLRWTDDPGCRIT